MSSSAGTPLPEPRVLFLLHRFPPVFGGGVLFLSRIRDAMLRTGLRSIVLTGNRGIPGGEQPGVHRLPSPCGAAFQRLDAYSFALMAGPALLALRRRYDLIHTAGNAHHVYTGLLAGMILDKPVVVYSVQNRCDDPGGIVQQRFGRLKNALFSRAAAYVCCSGLQMEAYRNAGYPMEKVHFIPNGIDLARFHPCASSEEKSRLRERLGLSRDEFTVVTVGAVCERKGVDLLAEAWIRFRGGGGRGKLLLVGPASPDDPGSGVDAAFVKSLRERLERAGVAESVLFAGRVGNVQDYLRAADLFTLMSRGEGFPLAILEAMCCGLPFVIWDLPDYSGYDLQDGKQGFLLPPFDVDRLANCLADLAGSPGRREDLGHRALAHGTRYTLDSAVAQHVALYREITARRRLRPGTPSPPGR